MRDYCTHIGCGGTRTVSENLVWTILTLDQEKVRHPWYIVTSGTSIFFTAELTLRIADGAGLRSVRLYIRIRNGVLRSGVFYSRDFDSYRLFHFPNQSRYRFTNTYNRHDAYRRTPTPKAGLRHFAPRGIGIPYTHGRDR